MRVAQLALATAFAVGAGHAVLAQSHPVVVELYTSQGCSSCPPADALLAQLADEPGVLPLALHVDYWDYIGWKDTFAHAAFTQRQRGYALAAGHRTIYTPQLVIGGVDHVVGNRPIVVADLIAAHQTATPQARVDIMRQGDMLQIKVDPQGTVAGDYVVQLVRYDPDERVSIGRGENAGETIDYVNVVTEWKPLAHWDGTAPMTYTAAVPGPNSIAVLVQAQNYGPILAAAAIEGTTGIDQTSAAQASAD